MDDLSRFSRPGRILVAPGAGGLPRVAIATAQCRAEIYLHGAHVAGWQPAGQAPVLWTSTQSWWEDGKPIRGGIPVCWPWFGPHPDARLPAHGCARQRPWTLEAVSEQPDGAVQVVMRLAADERSRALFPQDFALRLTATFGRALEVELAATNTGAAPITIGEALHTYLAVGDARRVAVHGLDNTPYVDRAGGASIPRVQPREPVTVAGETDRLHPGHAGEVTVQDPVWQRTLRVAKRGAGSTVVWNPWVEKAARMPDFGDHEWPGMLCVEAANAGPDAYTLAPGASHALATRIEVL